MQSEHPKQRFYDHLNFKFYWAKEKNSWQIGFKNEVIYEAKYVHMPTHRRNYIALDLDYEMAGATWMDEGFPEPTIVIITPETAHCKYLYELDNPVIYPMQNGTGTIKISWKAIKYFEGVKQGLDKALDGDRNFHGPAISNPIHPHFKVHWADKKYTLDELSEYCATVPKSYANKDADLSEGRHMYLFHTLRKSAYPMVKEIDSYEDFNSAVHNEAQRIYYTDIICAPGPDFFAIKEALDIAKSVVKWTWEHRNDPGLKQYSWEKGAMKLPQINYEKLSESEIESIHHQRKRLGARHTSIQKRIKTEKKIATAIDYLVKTKQRITKVNIAKISGISTSGLKRYSAFIEKVKNERV